MKIMKLGFLVGCIGLIRSAEVGVLTDEEAMAMINAAMNADPMYAEMNEYLQEADMGRSMSAGNSTDETAMGIRRLKQLKLLILHLQPYHFFSRYCCYGCWCLTNALHDIGAKGGGAPVDEIDGSCKRQHQCYECAKMDYPTRNCDASRVQYGYQLTYDVSDPDNYLTHGIVCKDPWGGPKTSCKRAICECDKKLAEDLRAHGDDWDANNHCTKSTPGFDRTTECATTTGTGSASGDQQCCGTFPTRFPFGDQNGGRACCNDKTYSTGTGCCFNGNIQSFGTC